MVSRKILLIDGNIATLKQARVTLEFEGFEVHQAIDGRAGIAEARRLRPAVVVAAATLQKFSGYDVCRTIRLDRSLAGTHVLLTTTSMDIYDEGRARRSGASGSLAKPFLPSQLLAAVSGMLNSDPPTVVSDPAADATPESSDSDDDPCSLEPRFVKPLMGGNTGDPMHNTGELPSGSIEVFDDSGDILADFADGPLPASIEQLMSRDLVDQMVAEAVRRHLEQRLPGLVERLVDEALKKRGS